MRLQRFSIVCFDHNMGRLPWNGEGVPQTAPEIIVSNYGQAEYLGWTMWTNELGYTGWLCPECSAKKEAKL